jgi:pectin methylesterase-like acyl-CoA thioesterase
MNRRALSMIICTAVAVSQASMIPTIANADSTGNSSTATGSTTGTVNSTASIGATTAAAANIIVNSKYTGDDGAKVDGIVTYKTIKAAIASIDTSNAEEKIIFIKDGTYKEKLTISTPNITLVGESAKGTIITFDDASDTPKRPEDATADGKPYGTTASASVTINSSAKNFKAANITIENSFDEANSSYANKQAVALRNEADHSVFFNCRFLGNQDTLFANQSKTTNADKSTTWNDAFQYYNNCYIEGDVDFIFGQARAVFEGCELHSVDRAGITPKGYIAAPSHLDTEKYGYLMEDCKLTSNVTTTPASVFLGRPWHPSSTTKLGFGVKSNVVYKNCDLGAHIAADGWSAMSNAGVIAYPKDNFMYEYENHGLGAVTTTTSSAVTTTTSGAATITNENRRQLTDNQAKDYTKENVLGGWNPDDAARILSSYGKNPASLIDNNVNIAETVTWNSTEFGTSTSIANNTISKDDVNKTVKVTAGSKDASTAGGKITGAQDGISYYYTEIDPSKNFEISADVKVNYFEKAKVDNQCGFGIMARDTIGTAGDTSTTSSNMVLVGGYRGAVESVFRNKITDVTGSGAVMEGERKFADRPANDGTATYKLKLKKTNTGYIASVDNGEEVIYYRPKQLEVLNSGKIYLGFFAARVASITVSNINLTTSNVATDPLGTPEPPAPITPAIDVKSPATTGETAYNLKLQSNVTGIVNVKLNGAEVYNKSADPSSALTIPATLIAGDNKFDILFTPTPGKTELVANINPVSKAFTVNAKSYGVEGGSIYVAQSGTVDGDGTIEKPLDINTAINYAGKNQTIKVKGGTYNFNKPINILAGNNGSEGKIKTLESYDGRAIFDFGKVSGGFTLGGDYWKIYGIDVTNTADKQRGLTVSGNNNVVENVKTYKNGDTGLQISGSSSDTIDKWPNNNLILNCESYDNMDAAMNNADGFAAKITVGYGNVFRGCISHNNCDDGWDLYTKSESGKIGPVMVENSIAYENGTLTDGTVTKGDGNGFKLGGEGIAVTHTLKNSLSFNNNSNGITSNSNPAIIVENSIGADNKKSNIDLHYYTGAVLQFKLTSDISFRTTTSGAADYAIDSVTNDDNYFYDGTKTSNKSGVEIKKDYFKSIVMPTEVKMDAKGNIIWPDYMKLANSTTAGGTTGGSTAGGTTGGSTAGGTTGGSTAGGTTGGSTAGGTTGGSTAGGTTGGSTTEGTTGGSTTGGTTGGTTAGETTTSSSSSHSHHNNSSSSSSSSNSVSSTASTTSTGSTNTATSNGDVANNVINLGNASKEQAKAIEKQVISKVSAILGEGTQVSAAKEVQTSDGNKLTVTALVKDGKNAGLVIAAEKSSAITTVQVDTSAGEVKAVYKFVPLLNKYIEITNTIVIDKNTITLPTQANATYVATADKLATSNVISEGWAKVDNSWYMVDKTGNPLTGWQKDSSGWVYLSPTNAAMETGWKQDGVKWYLLNNNGYMATGWVQTGDKWYYLNSDGAMASNTTVDGYTIGSDGALI